MQILVTGAGGLIGSHLVSRLLDQGHYVYGLDRTFNFNSAPYDKLKSHPRFRAIIQDVMEKIELRFQQIYHLACNASPIHYQQNPVDTCKTAFLGTLMMLELAKKNNCPLLIASTSEVYGSPIEHPQKETYWGHVNPVGIRSCYDEGKRCAETLAMDFHRMYQTQVKIVRIFNTYGPFMRYDGRVVSNFIINALNNEDIEIYGDGYQTRSFQYVDDLIDGFMLMIKTPLHVTGPINLGNPEEFTIIELAIKVLKKTGTSSRMVFKPLPEDDPQQRKPDITKARQLLGWSPKVSLDEGLDKTIEHFRASHARNLVAKL